MSKDYTKYWFNGKKYPKNRLVLAVVREYINQYPKLTLSDLKSVFPDDLQGSLGVIQKLQTAIDNGKQKRYFTNNEQDILVDGNNEKIVICNQWGVGDSGKGNFYDFLKKAERYNFDIKADTSPSSNEVQSSEEDSRKKALLELASAVYPEKLCLVGWTFSGKDPQSDVMMLVRELRRGWYMEIKVDLQSKKSNHRVFTPFLPVLDKDETVWHSITRNASESDWKNLDNLMKISWLTTGVKMFLAGPELLGKEVAKQAMEQFGFYVPDEELLPGLIWQSKELNLILLVYLKHTEKFAGQSMLADDNIDECEVFSSLARIPHVPINF